MVWLVRTMPSPAAPGSSDRDDASLALTAYPRGVAWVVADSETQAMAAARQVKVEYEALPLLFFGAGGLILLLIPFLAR